MQPAKLTVMMDWPSLLAEIEATTGLAVSHTTALKTVHGGDIHQAYHLHMPDGDYFLKLNQASALPLFQAEADSLNAIEQSQTLACPKPLGFGCSTATEHAWLLMTYLPLSTHGEDFQRGQAIAMLHHTLNPEQRFGWHQDNFIGHTPQYNDWHTDWICFYGEQRLKPQLELAKQKGAPSQLFTLGEQLMACLPKFFTHYTPSPSLLHGDLWSGNSAFLTHGEPVIFDPACYYGDRETDLAMTELFGGFSPAFYEGYHQVFPIDDGYPQRRPLYQLYHLLNHYNLFGGHYAQQCLRMMQTLIA